MFRSLLVVCLVIVATFVALDSYTQPALNMVLPVPIPVSGTLVEFCVITTRVRIKTGGWPVLQYQ